MTESNVWAQRQQAFVRKGIPALESEDPEMWAQFEDAFTQLPRTMVPREIDFDRGDAGARFRKRQTEEPDETFPLPFEELGGVGPGDLVVLAGAAKTGKSLVLDQCLESFYRKGANCRLYLSEMSPEKREARWVQRRLGIAMGRVLHKRLTPEEVERVAQEIDKHFPWDATKAHGRGFAEVSQMIVDHKPDVAAIDVLTKFNYDGQRELSNGVAQLHAAAESVGAALLIAAHLSRGGINRDTGIRRIPTPDDIKDASSVGEFADLCMLIHRKQATDEKGRSINEYLPDTKLYAPFTRDGEPTTVDLELNAERLRFDPKGDPTQEVFA